MEAKDWEWSIEHNMCVPIRSSLPPALNELLTTIYCRCKTNCDWKCCNCTKHDLECSGNTRKIWKCAAFDVGSKNDAINYRGITVLPVISMIVEAVFRDRKNAVTVQSMIWNVLSLALNAEGIHLATCLHAKIKTLIQTNSWCLILIFERYMYC
jgi:hypothetical protein